MESDSSYSADELGQYQSLSTSAVVAVVLGLLSSMAFFTPLLLVMPLIAAAVALWAVVRIKRSEGGLLGARLAYCGLALAIVFGVSAVARVQVRILLLRNEASKTAELWMAKLAEGEAIEAMELMTSSAVSNLHSPDETLTMAPIFPEAVINAQFLHDPLVKALREGSEKTRVLREARVAHEISQPRVVFIYDTGDPQAEVASFTLSMLKTKGLHSPSIWLIDGWQVGALDP